MFWPIRVFFHLILFSCLLSTSFFAYCLVPKAPAWIDVQKNQSNPTQSVNIWWPTSEQATNYVVEVFMPSGSGWFNILEHHPSTHERLKVNRFIPTGNYYGPQEAGFAQIIDMSAGHFTFRVKACNTGGCSGYTGGHNYTQRSAAAYFSGPLYSNPAPRLQAIDNRTFEITHFSTSAHSLTDTKINILLEGEFLEDIDYIEQLSPFTVSGPWGSYQWTSRYKLKENMSSASLAFSSSECIAHQSCSTMSIPSERLSFGAIQAPEISLFRADAYRSKLSWHKVPYADHYIVEYSEQQNPPLNWHAKEQTSEHHLYLEDDLSKAAWVRVKAYNRSSNEYSRYSEPLQVLALKEPQNLIATKNGTQVILEWEKVDNATHYEIETREDNWEWVNATESRHILIEDRDLTHLNKAKFKTQNHGKRQFRVASCSPQKCSRFSTPSSWIEYNEILSPPSQPTVLNAQSGLSISWEEIDDAQNYSVEMLVKGQWINYTSYLNFKSKTNVVGHQHSGGWTRFRVIACNQFVCSSPSSPSSWLGNYTKPMTPMQPKIRSYADSIEVAWEDNSDSNEFVVEESSNGINWINITNELSLSSTHFSVIRPAGLYAYRVAACESGNCSDFSPSTQYVTTYDQNNIYPPRAILVTPSRKEITIDWEKVVGATHYKLDLKANDNDWQHVTTVGQSANNTEGKISFNHAPRIGGDFEYRVSTCIRLSSGEWCTNEYQYSEKINHTVPFDYTNPTKLLASKQGNQIILSWEKVNAADFYKLSLSVDDQLWDDVTEVDQPSMATQNEISFSHSPHTSGKFQYSITACETLNGKPSCSGGYTLSNIIDFQLPECSYTPTLTVDSETSSLSWCRLTYNDIKKYEIFISQCKASCSNSPSREWTWFDTREASSIPFKEFSPLVGNYLFKVRGCTTYNQCFSWSNVQQSELYDLAQAPSLSFNRSAKQLEWSAIENAKHYILQNASYDVQKHAQLSEWINISENLINKYYKVDSKSVGTTIYRVRACFTNVLCTNWSNTISHKPPKGIIFVHTDLLGNPISESQ